MPGKSFNAVLSLIIATSVGCAAGTYHQVDFAGEVSPAADPREQGRTVYVVPNRQMSDSVVETEVRGQLEKFLLNRGYVMASSEKAELYVLATFGTGKRLAVSSASVFREAEVAIVRDRDGNPVRRTFKPARMESLRVPAYENSIWLQVLSSDAGYFRETGMVKNLWRGEASMQGKAESVPSAIPFLLVPALKYFGKKTKQLVTMDVREKDMAWRNQ